MARIAETLRDGLDLPGIHLEIDGPAGVELSGTAGEADLGAHRSVPLLWQGKKVGILVAAARPRSDSLDPVDERILADIAGPLGAAAAALRLSSTVEQAREHVVRAREEERRRIRRDIHDGLGPQLASIAHGIDAAINYLEEDRARSRGLLVAASKHSHDAVHEARRLVHDLRPPALDQLGMSEAVRGVAATLANPAGAPTVNVTVDGDMNALPAAVEVAAFHIAQEALTNAVRHAQATGISVSIIGGPPLVLEVIDDGIGYGSPRPGGIGVQTMRDRAAELGGTLELALLRDGGTRVRAVLPWGDAS